jgi:hypothetical protein
MNEDEIDDTKEFTTIGRINWKDRISIRPLFLRH